MDAASYAIGRRISLISSSDVRYEGRLYTVDPDEGTLALQDVNCMGTEGRRKGHEAIGPSQTTYEFIIFRVENVKQLYLNDRKQQGRKDLTRDLLAQLRPGRGGHPAMDHRRVGGRGFGEPKRRVGRADQGRPRGRSFADNPRGGHYHGYDNERRGSYGRRLPRPRYYEFESRRGHRGRRLGNGPRDQYEARQSYEPRHHGNRFYHGGGRGYDRAPRSPPQRPAPRGSPQGLPRGGPREAPGTGAFLEERNLRGDEIGLPKQEFDFAAGNARFDKAPAASGAPEAESKQQGPAPEDGVDAKEEAQAQEERPTPRVQEAVKSSDATDAVAREQAEPKYDKIKSFFDDLTTDNQSRKSNRPDRALDVATFGSVAQTYKSRHGGNRGFSRRSRAFASPARGRRRDGGNQQQGPPIRHAMKWMPRADRG